MRLTSRVTLPFFVFFSLLIALVIYWWGYDKPMYGIDDANIYFVYMRNLANGHGFVWNIGGEKVEGFTSLLWTLIGAVFYKLSGERYVWLLLALSFVLTGITVYRVLVFIRRCNNTVDRLLTDTDLLLMALLLFPLGFVEWNILGLMETGLWLFLIVNLTLELCNYYLPGKKPNLFLFSLLLAIMIPTRPESIAYGLLFLVILFVQQATEEGIKKAFYKVSGPLLTYIATLTALIAWRLSYFGYPFPNTYYAKVSGSTKDNVVRGLSYLHKFFYEYPQAAFTIGIGVAFALVLLVKWRKAARPSPAPLSTGSPAHPPVPAPRFSGNDKAQVILLVVIGAALCLPVLTGGDHFKYSRFYQCMLPLTYATVLNFTFWKNIGQFTVNSRFYRNLLTFAVSFGIFFIAKSTWYDFTTPEKFTATRISPEFFHARNGRTIADKENETFAGCSPYPSVGIIAAGGFAYDYKGNTIDLMGLNSTLMAHAQRIKHGFRNHASFDINTFWKLMPDMVGTFYGGVVVTDTAKFILPENMDDFRSTIFAYTAYKHIFDYPRFIETYLPALVRNKRYDYYIFAYYNRSFLNTLDKNCFQVILLERKIPPPKIDSPIE